MQEIRIGEYVGEEFGLESGVPQGGCLSPTLFNFYTHDMPNAERENVNVVYADDVTQIIRYRGRSKNMLRLETQREIGKINEYERMWKIRTNMRKFTITPVEGRRKDKVEIDGSKVAQQKALGLTIN